MKHEKNRNMLLLLLFTVFSVGLILYFTADSSTLVAIKTFNSWYFLVLFLMWATLYSFDAFSFYFMVLSSEERISVAAAYRMSALKTASMMLTPLGMGVTPALIYYLSLEKIPAGKSSSVVLTRVMVNALWILCGSFFSFFFNSSLIMGNRLIFVAFIITSGIQTLFILFVIFMMLFPYYVLGILIKTGQILSHFKVLKKTVRIKRILVHEASSARKSFKLYFQKHLVFFLWAVLLNGLGYATTLSVLYFILKGFGQQALFLHTVTFTALMIFIIGFLPTPGGSGLAEILFVLILSQSVSVSILGVVVVVWRFFIYYISTGIGLSFSLRYFSKIFSGKKKTETSL